MELNAEQIKKALECCVKSECNKCPLRDGRCANGEMGRLSLSLIKELTEENEKLYRLVDDKIQECEKWKSRLKIECEYTKADTVRKMQNLIAQKIGTYTKESYVYVHAWFKLIDQIAKEMLEDGK